MTYFLSDCWSELFVQFNNYSQANQYIFFILCLEKKERDFLVSPLLNSSTTPWVLQNRVKLYSSQQSKVSHQRICVSKMPFLGHLAVLEYG